MPRTPATTLNDITYKEYYAALLAKDSRYEGIFFVGVKTTGVFCRPTCPARKPKFENCEFFPNVRTALEAAYRPCKRCRPLSHPNHASSIIRVLVEAVESNPHKRWQNADLAALSISASTAQRHFKKRFGMTFLQYARARRMAVATQALHNGASILDAQLDTGYESSSGFRDAFMQAMGTAPSKSQQTPLHMAWLDSPLGTMVTIASTDHLYLLTFSDNDKLERNIERLRQHTQRAIIPERTQLIDHLQEELRAYFASELRYFRTPVYLLSTPFQQQVWQYVQNIPFGTTQSYSQLAQKLNQPQAVRAVASANARNLLTLLVPCHRVIRNNGALGGYAGGLSRKQWLLEHEQSYNER